MKKEGIDVRMSVVDNQLHTYVGKSIGCIVYVCIHAVAYVYTYIHASLHTRRYICTYIHV